MSERGMEVRFQDKFHAIKTTLIFLSLFSNHTIKSYIASKKFRRQTLLIFKEFYKLLREMKIEVDFERPSLEHCSILREAIL